MDMRKTYQLHPEVRFLPHANYAIAVHLGNGAWFKIMPWVEGVLTGLGAEPLTETVRRIANTHGLREDDVQRFFETFEQSHLLKVVATEDALEDAGLRPQPDAPPAAPCRGIVWRAPEAVAGGATQQIDTFVISGVQRLVLAGGWLKRDDLSDVLSLAQMVFGSVSLSADDASVSAEVLGRLTDLPESIDLHVTPTPEPLAQTRQALGALSGQHIDKVRVRMPLGEFDRLGPAQVFEVLDAAQAALDLSDLLPSDKDEMCLAGQLSHTTLTPEGVLGLLKQYFAHEVSACNIVNLQWFFHRLIKRAKRACGAGRCFAVVDADGGLYPCQALMSSETKLGDWLPGKTLAEMTAGSPVKDRLQQRTVDAIPGCRDCDVRYFCGGGCAANALHAGDLAGQDPFCAFYQKLIRTALAVWRDDAVLEDNFAALAKAL